MSNQRFTREVVLPVSAEEAFAWHERTGALPRLMPPWERVEVLEMSGGIAVGARVVMRVPMVPMGSVVWEAEHTQYEKGRLFQDIQKRGPFARWIHNHRFEPLGAGQSKLIDDVEYALPMGFLGATFGGGFALDKLQRMFAYRHRVTCADLEEHAKYLDKPRLRVLMTGASGLVGSALRAFLTTGGHEVVALKRLQRADDSELGWDWDWEGVRDTAFDAVVHLAAENIGDKRWDEQVLWGLRQSRVEGAKRLAAGLSRCGIRPKVVVSASAVGFYGDRGDGLLDESSARGEGFLAELCEAWEEAAQALDASGARVVFARLGVVLSPAGGALAKLLGPAKMGLAGPLGGGKPWLSWIAIDDALYAIHALIQGEIFEGPVNVVGPSASRSSDFAQAVGRAAGMGLQLPVPSFALRAAAGKLADEVLLASQHVVPKKLLDAGFGFHYPNLDDALRHLTGART